MSSLRSPRILVVDDEPAVRKLIERALLEAGYEVVAVNDGEIGLSAAKSANTSYDLVITNSYLPHMSGEQLIGRLRRLFPDLPILHVDDLAQPIGPNAEKVPTLYKPFSIEALLSAAAKAISDRRIEREA
jgi:DNA-binding response OmpR family regulator